MGVVGHLTCVEVCNFLAASVCVVLTVRPVVLVCAACDSMTVAGCVWGPGHAWHSMTGHTWLTCTQHASMPASPQGLCCIETIISFVAFALSSAGPDSCPRVQQQQLLTGPKQQSASFNVLHPATWGSPAAKLPHSSSCFGRERWRCVSIRHLVYYLPLCLCLLGGLCCRCCWHQPGAECQRLSHPL